MTGTVYLDGRFVPEENAVVPVTDRGLQFADGVYEVILVASGRPVDLGPHLARLERSMLGLRFTARPVLEVLADVTRTLIASDGIVDGMVYIQVTRGSVAPRNLTPDREAMSVIAYAKPVSIADRLDPSRAITVTTFRDPRRGRCDLKTTGLVGNVLARIMARELGYDDAWLMDAHGYVTEASAANAWIVRNDVLYTRPEGPEILSGVTRTRLIALAASCAITVEEKLFDLADCEDADEAFITSATALITPVSRIGGHMPRGGAPGALTTRLYDRYLAFLRSGANN